MDAWVSCGDECVVPMPESSAGYCFGRWTFYPLTGELLLDGEMVTRLEPKVAQVFALLLANAGQIVTRETILTTVWHDRIVVEESLSRTVSQIRSALGAQGRQFIQTLPKRGYRWVGEVASETSSPE